VIFRDQEAAVQRRAAAERASSEADDGGPVGAEGSRSDAQRADPIDP
jgi:hypothetical protein